MGERSCHALFIIFFFSLVVLSSDQLRLSRASTNPVRCHKSERKALMEIKRGLSDPSHRLKSWVGEDCCNNWEGIGCDNITGHVIKLDLRHLDPSAADCTRGTRASMCTEALCDELGSSLRSFQLLSYLDLSGNYIEIRGILQLLSFFGFEELKYLNLSCSGLHGKVPHQLGNLSTLHHLDLSYNDLYLENAGWISNLTSLQSFYMSKVSFEKSPNWLQSLNALPRIQRVQLAACHLSALPQSLPHVNFTSLIDLDLSDNSIVSSPPNWLFGLTRLEYLNLGGNAMHWHHPSSVGKLTALRSLKLSRNTFDADGLLLGALSDLCNLQILDLSYASLYDELQHNQESVFSGCLQFSLEELDLSNNILRGILPDWLGKMEKIKYLDLSNNSLQASVLASLRNLPVLRYLDISLNNLSWTTGVNRFPSSLEYLDLSDNLLSEYFSSRITNTMLDFFLPFCHIKNIRVIRLANNGLSGELPNCWNNSSELIILDLSRNNFYRGIPSTLCTIPNLQGLHLNQNNLSGQFPSLLEGCKNLVILDLSHNNFDGKIPYRINEILPSLRALILRSNRFSGKIPQLSHHAFLQILDLSNNCFDGSIPQDIGNFPGFKDILQMNKSSYANGLDDLVQVFLKGFFLWFHVRLLPYLKLIDLSNNHLSGKIPRELWDLNGMVSLNLSRNQIIGEIPTNIDECKFLEVLDLAMNNLSGEIPSSLGALPFLTLLNLSYNNFHGRIPQGDQLQTFDSSSYIGNPGLYGFPYNTNVPAKDSEYIKIETKASWKYGSMGIGFGFGILAICAVFYAHREFVKCCIRGKGVLCMYY